MGRIQIETEPVLSISLLMEMIELPVPGQQELEYRGLYFLGTSGMQFGEPHGSASPVVAD